MRSSTRPSRQVSRWPGRSRRTPLKTVRGGRAAQNVKTSSMPSGSGSARDEAGGEERLGLAREDERAVLELGVEERADAEAVAHEHQLAAVAAPLRERPLAVEAVERGGALAVEQPLHDLGVGAGAQRAAVPSWPRRAARSGCRPRRCRSSASARPRTASAASRPGCRRWRGASRRSPRRRPSRCRSRRGRDGARRAPCAAG